MYCYLNWINTNQKAFINSEHHHFQSQLTKILYFIGMLIVIVPRCIQLLSYINLNQYWFINFVHSKTHLFVFC